MIRIIILLILISGAVAYVGNRIGRFFGKRRLSLFGMRPRYTATVFTVVSGILIAVITFTTLIAVSQEARTALFGLEELRGKIRLSQSELQSKTRELESIRTQTEAFKKEIYNLQSTKSKLKKEVEAATHEKVLFSAGEEVYITVLKGGVGAAAAESNLQQILNNLDKSLKKYKIQEVQVDRTDFASTVSFLANYEGEVVFKIISTQNVTVGGMLPVRLLVQGNQLVYKKGEEIAKDLISSRLTNLEIEQKIKDLLSAAHYAAREKGVLPDVTGSLGSVPYAKIFEAQKRVKGYPDSLVTVSVTAAKDIFSVGPLDVEFRVNR